LLEKYATSHNNGEQSESNTKVRDASTGYGTFRSFPSTFRDDVMSEKNVSAQYSIVHRVQKSDIRSTFLISADGFVKYFVRKLPSHVIFPYFLLGSNKFFDMLRVYGLGFVTGGPTGTIQ
jgi:hypothetical protein